MNGSAVISTDGVYRYTLDRWWTAAPGAEPTLPPMMFVMLNPSMADATADDPTIRRCVGFARQYKRNRLIVANLFAYRATDPNMLKSAWMKGIDVVGSDNREYIQSALDLEPTVVCAWGTKVPRCLADHVDTVRGWIEGSGLTPLCLGRTKDGSPRHPLYIKGDTQLEEYR